MNPRNIWPATVLVAVVTASVAAVLIVRPEMIGHLDGVMAVLVAPLLAALLGMTNAIRRNTNGHTSELIALVDRQDEIIARLPASESGRANPPPDPQPPTG
ncbi:MAG TPA: hypothetical protein VK659_10290 [Asanoa sp.]|nr:hypothetical protein [Asanoa sp.]